MVDYNPKAWRPFLLVITKADTLHKLGQFLLYIAIYALVVAVIVLEVFHVDPNSDLRGISTIHSLLGFVLSLILAFRTNSAYDRWWEGRKLWGSLVNNSRNLAIKLAHILRPEDADGRAFFREMIPNYAFALKNHLRGEFRPDDLRGAAEFSVASLDAQQHVPNQLAMRIFEKLDELYQAGVIKPEHLLVLNPEFQSLTDICGACERIKNTPIPYSYSSFLKKFVFLYCLTLPLGYVLTLHYWVIPVVVFIFYTLVSLEVIAEEIENPFGEDANDLPTDDLSANIRKSIAELLSAPPLLQPDGLPRAGGGTGGVENFDHEDVQRQRR
jgi:putative membrane protein